MIGDESGNFNPDQNVTRNEMAVVMSNLMEYNVASYKNTSPFTDVPAWAEPYVAACYTNGITSGYSDTIYGGSDTVTTAQAALMLMKALGYFQYASDFGSDWQLATTRQGNDIDLFDGVDSGVTQAMTPQRRGSAGAEHPGGWYCYCLHEWFHHCGWCDHCHQCGVQLCDQQCGLCRCNPCGTVHQQ